MAHICKIVYRWRCAVSKIISDVMKYCFNGEALL